MESYADCDALIQAFGLDDETPEQKHARDSGGMLELRHPPLVLPSRAAANVDQAELERMRRAKPRYAEELFASRTGFRHVLNRFMIVTPRSRYEADIIQVLDHGSSRDEQKSLPLTTGGSLYLPATYTMLDALLSHDGDCVAGRRVCELGAGLGLLASILQQHRPPPRRLLATDGDVDVLPMLRANVEANMDEKAEEAALRTEVEELLWGEPLRCDLKHAFDLVVATDAIFSAQPPADGGRSRLGSDPETAAQVEALVHTATGLLDPSASPAARLVLTAEPRDRLKAPSADPLRGLLPRAAEAAGLRCLEHRERRLTGQLRPEWETDVAVFELVPRGAPRGRASSSSAEPRGGGSRVRGVHGGTSAESRNEWRDRRWPETSRQTEL